MKIMWVLIAMAIATSSTSYAASKKEAFCTCFGARSVIFVGAGMGKTARSYGVDTDLPLLAWRGVISEWLDKLEVNASECPPVAAEDSAVLQCRQYMKLYPDGKF